MLTTKKTMLDQLRNAACELDKLGDYMSKREFTVFMSYPGLKHFTTQLRHDGYWDHNLPDMTIINTVNTMGFTFHLKVCDDIKNENEFYLSKPFWFH